MHMADVEVEWPATITFHRGKNGENKQPNDIMSTGRNMIQNLIYMWLTFMYELGILLQNKICHVF